ncbi:MAG: tetratricopeptide repeat protein [Pseudomonadota bacterium]
MHSFKKKKSKSKTATKIQNIHIGRHDMDITQALQLANSYCQAGQAQQAENMYQQILTRDPDNAQAYSMLGILAGQSGNMDRAVLFTQKAIQIDSATANFHYNLGIMFKEQGRLSDAVDSYRKAIVLKPDFVNALYNLANALQADGQFEEAIACYRQVVAIRPLHAEAYNNLGILLKEGSRFDESLSCYRKALSIAPDFAEAHSNLGLLLQQMGHLDEAESCQRKAISLNPDLADAHYNLGIVLKKKGLSDEAIDCYQNALSLEPDSCEALVSLGNALNATGQLDEALASYQKALADSSDNNLAWSNFLLTSQYIPAPSPAELFQQHLRFAEQFEAPLKKSWEHHDNTRDPAKRLKIGYVSADFRGHSVACFIEPVLAGHSKKHVEIFCYYSNTQQDDVTRRIAACADHWIPCADMSDQQLDRRIRDDRIDILVDLSGHTDGNRLLVFAGKPAPVQVTWIGYPDTTGLTAMDYRLTDNYADPPGKTEQYHSERLFRLPGCFLCFAAPSDSPAIAAPPFMKTGRITFASFNNLTKTNEPLISLWAEILQAIPSAQLLLKATQSSCESVRNRLWRLFDQNGVTQERIRFAEYTKSFMDHLGLYGSVDIALDTFPYNGTTTTCEALWMGVPVITLAGTRHVARVGGSILSGIGLGECIAESGEDYVKMAVTLATDHDRLRELRETMRERIFTSPLCDAKKFTRDLEGAYQTMWRTWCFSG